MSRRGSGIDSVPYDLRTANLSLSLDNVANDPLGNINRQADQFGGLPVQRERRVQWAHEPDRDPLRT